jgi:hypothetical protein
MPTSNRRPMRVHIDKHSNAGRHPDGRTFWIVSPSFREPRDDGSYRLEIRHDFSGEPDTLTRVVYQSGTRHEVMPDEAFDARVQVVMENELYAPDGMTQSEAHQLAVWTDVSDEDRELGNIIALTPEQGERAAQVRSLTYEEAAGKLHDLEVWPEQAARAFGFDPSIFNALEAAWTAANVFIDFGISG